MCLHRRTGLRLLNRPCPQQPQPPRNLRCRHRLRYEWERVAVTMLWYGRLQLLFRCTLCSLCARLAPWKTYGAIPKCTFEPVDLTPNSVMQQEGVPMFYDSASCSALPCLYICPVKNVLGRVPMIPCFVAGNSHPTIPHGFARSGRAVLGSGMADTRPDSGNGSRLYELNLWMWRYGRGQVRKVSVAKAMEARVKRLREARARAGETAKRRRVASAARAAAAH